MEATEQTLTIGDLRPEVARIYRDGIAIGNATFETEVPTRERWDGAHLPQHLLLERRSPVIE